MTFAIWSISVKFFAFQICFSSYMFWQIFGLIPPLLKWSFAISSSYSEQSHTEKTHQEQLCFHLTFCSIMVIFMLLQILLNVRLIFHFAKIKESNTRNKKGMNFRLSSISLTISHLSLWCIWCDMTVPSLEFFQQNVKIFIHCHLCFVLASTLRGICSVLLPQSHNDKRNFRWA